MLTYLKKHASHMWMCLAMLVGAVVLVLTTGRATAFIPLVACMAMMFMMMSMMNREGGGSDKGSS